MESVTPPDSTTDLLHEGIKAAKMGQHARAREILTQALALDERNITAWLWLSSVAETLQERQVCLENVLVLDPDNEAARRGLAKLEPHQPDQLLEEGIAAIEAGERDRARELLTRAVEQDERNAPAWLWLSSVVDSLDDKEICYENVLTLEPDNQEAQRGLAAIREEQKKIAQDALEQKPPVTLDLPSTSPVDRLKDPYQCPYCAGTTKPEDRICPHCQGALYVRTQKQVDRSPARARLLALQIASSGLHLVGLIMLLAYVEIQVQLDDPMALLRVYLGSGGDLPENTILQILELIPQAAVVIVLVLLLFSLIVLLGILVRLKWIFYLFVANTAGTLITGAMVTALLWAAEGWGGREVTLAIRAGLVLLDLSLLLIALVLILEIRPEMFFQKERLLMRLDRNVKEGLDLLAHGRAYAKRGMWALAALHLHRGVPALPRDFELEGHLALALSYINLEWYDLAGEVLQDAQRLAPEDPGVNKLNRMLEQARS
jgi:tetratricopeptide (TPR) repeat protein